MIRDNNLPEVKKENIFTKIINFFKGLTRKNVVQDNYKEELIKENEISDKDKFIQQLKSTSGTNISNLQKDIIQEKIKIEDLSDKELDEMITLYKRQIEEKKLKLKKYRKIITNQND